MLVRFLAMLDRFYLVLVRFLVKLARFRRLLVQSKFKQKVPDFLYSVAFFSSIKPFSNELYQATFDGFNRKFVHSGSFPPFLWCYFLQYEFQKRWIALRAAKNK